MPRADAFFTKVYSHVTYGGTFDGCGGTGLNRYVCTLLDTDTLRSGLREAELCLD